MINSETIISSFSKHDSMNDIELKIYVLKIKKSELIHKITLTRFSKNSLKSCHESYSKLSPDSKLVLKLKSYIKKAFFTHTLLANALDCGHTYVSVLTNNIFLFVIL